VWVIALAYRGLREGRRRDAWLAGALLAQAFLIKYVALALLLPVVAMIRVNGSPGRLPALLRLGAGFVLGLAPWLLGLALSGSLSAIAEMQGLSAGYAHLPLEGGLARAIEDLWRGYRWFLRTHAALLVASGLGLLALRSRPPLERALALGWLIAALLGYTAQLKAFPYHSLPLLSPMTLLAAVALRRLSRAPRWARVGGWVCCWGSSSQPWPAGPRDGSTSSGSRRRLPPSRISGAPTDPCGPS
jgi:hypothetical protein